MELYIYNQSLELQGVIDDFFSLRWRRKYFMPGEFELHCNLSSDNLGLFNIDFIISKRGAVECGIIEDILIEDNSHTGETIVVKGRFLSSILDRRITDDTIIIKDTAKNAMLYYIDKHLINPNNTLRKIPLLQLGNTSNDNSQIQVQATYKSVLATLIKLSKKSTQGFRIRVDFSLRQLFFDIYQGVDRSVDQSENTQVILSDEYDNTKNTTYTYSTFNSKTYCKVSGIDENENKIFAEVGGGGGLARKEVHVSGHESKPEEMDYEDYKLLLIQNGQDVLSQARIIENLEFEIDLLSDYKVSWDLGDIVTCVKKRWGIFIDERITEVEEVYENGIMRVIPVLGSPKPEIIDLLKED